MVGQQTDLASSNSVYRGILGRSQTRSKMDDVDLLFQGHVNLLISENVTDWLWDAISRQQMNLAFSNSVYRCIWGRFQTCLKMDDVDLLFQGRDPIKA